MQLQNQIREISHQSSLEDGTSQNSQSNIMQSQIASQLQNQQQCQYSVSQQNCSAPLSQFSNSFSVFSQKRKPTSLSTFMKIKSHHQYVVVFSQIKQYMQINYSSKYQTFAIQSFSHKNKQNQNPDQFFYASEIPQNCTFVTIVKPLSNGRCNIDVYNLSGFIVAYYSSIKICKKFSKIYKLISKLPQPCLLIVLDKIPATKFQYSYFKKISEICENYLYIINNFTQHLLTISSQQILPNQFFQVSQNQMLQRVSEKVYYFSQLFSKNHSECFRKVDFLIQSLENSKQQIFSRVGINKSEQQRNLSFDALIINTAKLYVYKSDDIANKILQIFQMNQQKIAQGNQQIKFGQKEWHTPEAMKQCRDCLYCSKHGKINKKKTKYRCEGCSAQSLRQISLCVLCFKKFHLNQKIKRNILRSAGGKSKKIKKQKLAHNIKDDENQDMKPSSSQSKAEEKKVIQTEEAHDVYSYNFQEGPFRESRDLELNMEMVSKQENQRQNLKIVKANYEYLKDLKELSQLRQSIFCQIEALKCDSKYEVAKESLELFLSRLIIATAQLQERMASLSLNSY